ncbi:hypothetical protein NPIL_231 [Nephila pilipes]|uniref:Uncharacterized protein n=1 Tax=Nephila pilipes TaxID=299642 RepID=A0A8X6QT98_NEPPI|nr:hypothetical protein NPIL_231 [Nephila pilipes]
MISRTEDSGHSNNFECTFNVDNGRISFSVHLKTGAKGAPKPGALVIPEAHKGPDNQIFIGCQDLRPAEMKTDAPLRPTLEAGRVEAMSMRKNRNPAPHL